MSQDLAPINVNATEAARLLGISRATLYGELIHRTDFPVYRIGRRVVIPYRELQEWSARQKLNATSTGLTVRSQRAEVIR